MKFHQFVAIIIGAMLAYLPASHAAAQGEPKAKKHTTAAATKPAPKKAEPQQKPEAATPAQPKAATTPAQPPKPPVADEEEEEEGE